MIPLRATEATACGAGAAAAVEIQDHLAATFGARVHVRGRPDLSFTGARQVVGAATIDTLSVTGLTATVESADALVISTCLSGVVTCSDGGSADVLWPGQSVVIAQPGQPPGQRIRSDAADVVLVSLDIHLVADIAAAAPDFDGTAPRFTRARPEPAAERSWRQTLALLTREVLAGSPAEGRSTLVRAETGRLVAAMALETFPNNALPFRRPSGPPPGRRETALDRARTFVEDHADLDIGVSDIAGAACVTERALQLAFRRHLDTTPSRYLRTVRLGRAHEMLTAAHPEEGVTITDVAARWGFYNTGRFTAYYREAYGVLPSETLRDPSSPGGAMASTDPIEAHTPPTVLRGDATMFRVDETGYIDNARDRP